MILLNEPHVLMTWDEATRSITVCWKGFISFEKVKAALTAGATFFKEKGCQSWLADMSELGTFSKEAQDWTTNEWIPRMLKAGLKRTIFVTPKSAMTRLALNTNVSRTGPEILETLYFDNLAQAQEWLRSH